MRLVEDCQRGDILTVNRFGRVKVARGQFYGFGPMSRLARWFWKERYLGVASSAMPKGEDPWRNSQVFHGGMTISMPVTGQPGDLWMAPTSDPIFKVTEVESGGDDGFAWVQIKKPR